MVKEVLTKGYRVVYRGKYAGAPYRSTVFFKTKEEAERMSDSLTRDGERVVKVEKKL